MVGIIETQTETTKLESLYNMLVNLVDTEMDVAMCKTDIEDFEIHPAIGFGLPIISDDLVTGSTSTVQLSIPVVIEDYGSADAVNMNVVTLYEKFRKALEDHILDYATDNEISISSLNIETFQRNLTIPDPSIRGMIGNITIIMDL